jgi:endonuclease YncB( thermonuclease family)
VIALLTVAAPAFLVAAGPFAPRVVAVVDGDTIDVIRDDVPDRDPIRIRLFGIDTPERRQPYYAKAKEFMAAAVFGNTVTVQPRGKHFQRLVADVVMADGKMLTQELVRAGLAWWYEKHAPYDRPLERLQTDTRSVKRGLWSDEAGAVPPWEWRRR